MNVSELLAAALESFVSQFGSPAPNASPPAVREAVEALPDGATTPTDETPPYIHGTYLYRTRDDRAWFRFSTVHTDGGLRVYIVSQPPYGDRPTGTHTIHRLFDGEHFYICFNGLLATPEDAMSVAEEWAERTWRYIETGRRFEDPLP